MAGDSTKSQRSRGGDWVPWNFGLSLVSLIVVIFSKDQKTTQFRQAWIDAFRDEFSQFDGIATTLISTTEIVIEE